MPMVITVDVDSNIGEVTAEVESKVEAWLEAIGSDAITTTQNIIQQIPLVKTGTLRNSISMEVDMNEYAVYIGTNVYYAEWQEVGTSKMEGKHFLQAGASIHSEEYKSLLQSALSGD